METTENILMCIRNSGVHHPCCLEGESEKLIICTDCLADTNWTQT